MVFKLIQTYAPVGIRKLTCLPNFNDFAVAQQ